MLRATLGLLCSIFIVYVTLGTAAAQVPQRTTATFDDWTISCEKSCEAISVQQSEGVAVSQITIKKSKGGALTLSVQVPPSVWFASGLKLGTESDEASVRGTFKWCIPARCLAEVEVNADVIKKLSSQPSAQIVFQDAAQHEKKISVSLKGLSPTLNKLLAPS
ncbi:invasion protein IalB [Bradyrhizobium sp. LB7.2]